MNTVISKDSLMHALTVGGACAGKNKVVPIFEFVKCEVKDGEFVVRSYDGECSVNCSVPYVDTDADFAFCVNAKDFVSTIKSIKDDNVAIEVSNTLVLIKHNKGVAQLPIVDADSFPVIEYNGVAQSCVISSEKMIEWIKVAQNFVAKDELRPVMMGLYMSVTPNLCEVCATDAHKMFCDDHTLYGNDSVFNAVLPARCFNAVLSVLSTCDEVTIYNYDKNLEFRSFTCSVVCRKIEGNFPNYKAVIPSIQPNQSNFVVKKSDFIESASRAGMYADISTSRLELEVNNNKLHITGRSVDFDKVADEFIDVKSNVCATISLKADYLLSCLNSIFDNDVLAYMFDSNRPIVFKDAQRGGKTILQMPMVG